ncbi:MAG: MATE family efflux transporter [Dehalococcoidales bacterium]
MGFSPGRRAAFGKDWTKGNTFKNLLSLSWPMAVTNLLMMLGPTIDMIWVGKLGSAAIAGVGVAGMAVQLVVVSMMGMMMGVRALIARFIGAGDIKGANQVIAQAFVIGFVFSIAMGAIGIFFAEPILIGFGLEADVVKEGAAYLRILFVGGVAMSLRIVSEASMQASGDTVTPMKIAIGYRVLHIALAPVLIFGLWIFPRMGVSGAAVTNIVSQSLGGIIGIWVLLSGRSLLRLSFRNFRLDLNIIWRMVKIGFPALITAIQRSFSQIVLMWFIVPFGTLAVAAHTINQRVEMMLFMPGMSLGMGAGVLIGQNLGAGQPERAERAGWLAVAVVEGLMVIGSILILVGAEYIIRVFNTEPGLVALASSFLRIAVAGYVVVGLMGVLQQALSGAGDTIPTMIISLATVWVVTLPLAYFLPRVTDLGVLGIRWAMVAGVIFPAVALTVYFKLGRWKRKKV